MTESISMGQNTCPCADMLLVGVQVRQNAAQGIP